MKKRLGLAVGGLAVTLAAAIPASGAFGCVTSPHCAKYGGAIETAALNVGLTNSQQSSNVQGYLTNAAMNGKCA
ncbi:MAG: hypothetical protein JO086_17125 [Acidimicrobiia bacterium]|nr:hypothetical protein [Acidimicrobiia bacterium]